MYSKSQKLSILKVLLDLIHADGRVDPREVELYNELIAEFELSAEEVDSINNRSAIISLLDLKELGSNQKIQFASLMDKMIKIDDDIDIREVAIYDIVIGYCEIPVPFAK